MADELAAAAAHAQNYLGDLIRYGSLAPGDVEAVQHVIDELRKAEASYWDEEAGV